MRTRLLLSTLVLALGPTLQADQIPACMLNYQMGPEQHLLIVDKASHTLFVFSNQSASPLARFTVTTGKKTGQKQVEGDHKTPEGIYFFTQIIAGPNLPKTDDYGEKAFVTDYPNPVDTLENRKGSGIWLHGAHDPEKTSSPNNSRGCVVMQNDDLTRVSKYIYLNQTPLCIYETIPYVSVEEIVRTRDQILGQLSHWKQSWEAKDTAGYMSHFAADFSNDGLNREAFRRHKEALNSQYRYIRVLLNNLTLYGFDSYVVVRFNQVYISDKNHFHTHKIQYWSRLDPGRLAIRAELTRRLPMIDRIEIDQGNFVSLSQFRTITEKKIRTQPAAPRTEEIAPPVTAAVVPVSPRAADLPQTPVTIGYPGLQTIKTSRVTETRLDCELTFGSKMADWRFIPVLTILTDGVPSYISLSGIRLNDGMPANPELGKLLSSQDQQVQFDLPPGAQTRSMTLFIIGPDNQIRQVITSLFTP